MIRTPPPSRTSTVLLQLQLLLPDVYNFNCSWQTSTTSTAPARRLQLQQLLPDVYNFSSTDSNGPSAPTRYSNEPPGPSWYSTVHTYFIRPTFLPLIQVCPKCHSPIRPRQIVTPQFVPDKMSLPKSVPQSKCHSPIRPGQNVTPQFVPDKLSLPSSSHRQNVTPQFVPL